jgi:steroid delta-isomerase-like uncharacterized protein
MNVEDNLRVADRINEAFNTRNWDLFNDQHTDDVIAYSPILDEPTRDIDSHRRQLEEMVEAFPDFKVEKIRTFGQGDWVCAEFRITGTHTNTLKGGNGNQDIPATNKSVELNIISSMRFMNGKIQEEHNYWDRMAFLEQLGLVPKP